MKTAIKLLLGLAVLWVVLMLGTGLAAKAMLSGPRIQTLVGTLQAGWPVQVTASGGDFDLAAWFRFRPVVAIRDLRVTNPPGYSAAPLLEARQVSAQVALFSVFRGSPQIQSLVLEAPVLNIEESRAGKTNLEVLIAALGKERAPGGDGESAGGTLAVDEFAIRSGTIRFLPSGRRDPTLTVSDLDVTLADFGSDRSCSLKLGARLFNGRQSRIDFNGRVGPSRPVDLPAGGALALRLAPAEMPAALRAEYFGDLLRQPPAEARVTLEASLQGNLLADFQGTGKLAFDHFQTGRDGAHHLGLRGEAPLRLTIRRPLTAPSFEIETQEASLELGSGRWKGRAEVRYDGRVVRGASSGAISGVDIDQMLAAFAASKGKVSGVAEIPDYQLRFAGKNAAEIRSSLTGQGNLQLDKGRIAVFDLLGSIERAAKRLLTGETSAAGQTDFTTLRSHFEIGGQRVDLTSISIENATSRTTGQGYVTFSEELSFDLVTDVTGALAQLLGGRPDASGQPHAKVPVRIRGTLSSPRVTPDVGKMAVDTLKEKATGFLDRLLQPKKK